MLLLQEVAGEEETTMELVVMVEEVEEVEEVVQDEMDDS